MADSCYPGRKLTVCVFAMPEGSASGKPCRGEISIESMPPRIVEHQSEGVVTDTEAVTNRLKNGAILATEGHLSNGSNRQYRNV